MILGFIFQLSIVNYLLLKTVYRSCMNSVSFENITSRIFLSESLRVSLLYNQAICKNGIFIFFLPMFATIYFLFFFLLMVIKHVKGNCFLLMVFKI